MSKVILDISMPLDGFINGQNGRVKGLKSGAPEMVEAFTVISAGRWSRCVTGTLDPPPRLETLKPGDPTAQEPTPAFAA